METKEKEVDGSQGNISYPMFLKHSVCTCMPVCVLVCARIHVQVRLGKW